MNIFINFIILIISMLLLIKGASLATRYALLISKSFNLSKYIVGFLVVAVISILPETFISINSALRGFPELGLGTLFGSNVADLTLVFAIAIWVSRRDINIKNNVLQNNLFYPFILLFPIILGLDGNFSRVEGVLLILFGAMFYFLSLKNEVDKSKQKPVSKKDVFKNSILLILSMGLLLLGSNFAVTSGVFLAEALNMNTILVGILVIGLGTTMPELFFAIKSMKSKHDSLAVGDILGTVLADATIVVGLLALIHPFSFPEKTIYITGGFMVIASFVLFYFMKTGKSISKKESILLFLFWIIFVIVEFFINSRT